MRNIIKSVTAEKNQKNTVILYVTNNLSQAELALLSIIGSEFEFLIFINETQKEYNFQTDYKLPDNAKITTDYKSVIMLTPIFSAVITTVGHISPVLNVKIISILKACIASEIPIIEVPHGLYQWGYNLADDSKFINTASQTLGGGYPIPSFADHQISWFDNSGVGYPRNREEKIKSSTDVSIPKYTVITTNTNWYMYNFEDQRVLVQSLFQYAKLNPERLFIWCQHPAEIAGGNLISSMYGAKPLNILRYGHDKDVYFHSIDTTEEVIQHAEAAITTISTCLLDFEIHKIPTAIFKNTSLTTIVESIEIGALFSGPNELCKLEFIVPRTGHLERFNVKIFDRKLNQFLRNSKTKNIAQKILMTL